MKNKVWLIRITVIFFAAVSLICISDNLFSNAGEKEKSLEVSEKSSAVPAAVRNFEMNLQHTDNTKRLKHYDVKGKGKNGNVFGYVQIWESEQSLSHYMKISKEYMSANVFGFREGTITVNQKTWYKWDYIVADMAVSQGFYEQNGKIYLCSLCVPYQEKTYAFDKMFIELLESVI